MTLIKNIKVGKVKKLILKHYKQTNSENSKFIIENFEKEMNYFFQVCPKEMINKLENPISIRKDIKAS